MMGVVALAGFLFCMNLDLGLAGFAVIGMPERTDLQRGKEKQESNTRTTRDKRMHMMRRSKRYATANRNVEAKTMRSTSSLVQADSDGHASLWESEYQSADHMQGMMEFIQEAPDVVNVTNFTWFGHGRAGNHIIQVAHAIAIAEYRGVPVLLPREGMIWSLFNQPENSMIKVQKVPNKQRCTVTNKIQWPLHRDSNCSACWTIDEESRILRTYLKPLFKGMPTQGDDSELVIHLRGGDIFQARAEHHFQANQPPCAAYDFVIANYGYKKISIITSSDMLNPCVAELPKRHRNLTVRVQSESMTEDYATLLSARNLFIAHSTFSYTAYLMSERVTRAFIMQVQGMREDPLERAPIYHTPFTRLCAKHQDSYAKQSMAARISWMVNASPMEISAAPAGSLQC